MHEWPVRFSAGNLLPIWLLKPGERKNPPGERSFPERGMPPKRGCRKKRSPSSTQCRLTGGKLLPESLFLRGRLDRYLFLPEGKTAIRHAFSLFPEKITHITAWRNRGFHSRVSGTPDSSRVPVSCSPNRSIRQETSTEKSSRTQGEQPIRSGSRRPFSYRKHPF